jgi:hypothetical protein
VSIRFSVLQYGVPAIQTESGTTIEADNVAQSDPGHCVADFTFTGPGTHDLYCAYWHFWTDCRHLSTTLGDVQDQRSRLC